MGGRRNRSGPPPKPSALRLLDGSDKANPHRVNREEPQPTDELGSPPASLSAEARQVWRDEAPFWATGPDRAEFARYCNASADYARHRETCEREGWVVETEAGSLKRHPASILYREAVELAHKLCVEFGMTPASRTRVKVPRKIKRDALSGMG